MGEQDVQKGTDIQVKEEASLRAGKASEAKRNVKAGQRQRTERRM